MKHPGIYLHTNPTDPDSPLWMLHWSSLTLARLILTPDPVLTVHAETSPPDAVIESFGKVIDSMAPGMSEGLTMIASSDSANPPPRLFMAPADPAIQGFAAIDTAAGLGIACPGDTGPIGPIWRADPGTERDDAIRDLAEFAKESILRLADKRFPLELCQQSSYFPVLWIARPNLIAQTAQPATD